MSSQPPEALPPYAYVPGGPWPHPRSSPRGHSAGGPHPAVPPIDPRTWNDSPTYARGIELFNAGYYWEAHESWEALWHAHGRVGEIADLLRGLIKLAAAGVKIREGRPNGAVTHAGRASLLFRAVAATSGACLIGLDLETLARLADRIATGPLADSGPPGEAVWHVPGLTIETGSERF